MVQIYIHIVWLSYLQNFVCTDRIASVLNGGATARMKADWDRTGGKKIVLLLLHLEQWNR